MAVVKFQSSEQTNFQNQLQNSNWWQISNPQIAKVNNLTPVQQTQPLNSTFKTDTTIWGNNFYIPNGWQGQQNALVNTWAVAWIKENNLWSLNNLPFVVNWNKLKYSVNVFKIGVPVADILWFEDNFFNAK